MISGTLTRRLLGLLPIVLTSVLTSVLTCPTANAATELDELLAQLAARDEPALAFTETRRSELLDEPVEISGTLYHDGSGRLVRETETPRVTTQTLTEDHVEIRRPNGHRQRFSLDRAPELRVLRQALVALLDGDRSALDRYFEVSFDSAAQTEPSGWSLRLVPRSDTANKQVAELELRGAGDQLASLVVRLNDGEALHTRFGPQQ